MRDIDTWNYVSLTATGIHLRLFTAVSSTRARERALGEKKYDE